MCREEYIRLLEQALGQLGFGAVAEQLERESGVQLEAPEIGLLRSAVMGGDFEAAVRLLGQLPLTESEVRRAQFAVLEQKFLEVSPMPRAAYSCLTESATPETRASEIPYRGSPATSILGLRIVHRSPLPLPPSPSLGLLACKAIQAPKQKVLKLGDGSSEPGSALCDW